ncbi:hypothetical protein SCUCBS95973_004452 [Sporothrix curviconia]|uniref:Amidase domain-containing protein n=1 Tax=Sporothrix curviconia TaxID=1260050 RepID=A0ABP0BQI8_9PEZI
MCRRSSSTFIHPELKFSDSKARDVLGLLILSEANHARVMGLPAKFLTADELAITALNAEDIPPTTAAGIHQQFGRVRCKGYCATVNVLDFSACTLPVTTMDVANNPPDRSETEDGFGKTILALQCDRDRWIRENYARNLQEYQGMPIVLQIVCKRWEEEKVLAISEVVQSVLKKE